MIQILSLYTSIIISNQGQGHLHAGTRPWKAAEGGIHWSVEFSYQVSPNVHTKCVLLSKCNRMAMWLSNNCETRPFENPTKVSEKWNVWISVVRYSDGYSISKNVNLMMTSRLCEEEICVLRYCYSSLKGLNWTESEK